VFLLFLGGFFLLLGLLLGLLLYFGFNLGPCGFS
jgi:hypothetical protein